MSEIVPICAYKVGNRLFEDKEAAEEEELFLKWCEWKDNHCPTMRSLFSTNTFEKEEAKLELLRTLTRQKLIPPYS